MNKKTLLLVTGLVLTLSVAGCSNKKDTAETETAVSQEDVITGYLIDNAQQYVTLSSYKDLEVEKPIYEVTDEDVNMEIENYLYEMSQVQETDRGAQVGDILTVDLKATIEGDATPYFEEEDYAIELGYEEFGPEFDEQLEGCKAGDTKSISCSFEEEDGYDDWVGKTVNFEISIKMVEEIIIPEYDDDFIKNMGYDSKEDFETYLKENLADSYAEQSDAEAQTNALLSAIDQTQFNGYPDKLYDSCSASVKEQYAFFAETSGMSESELYEAFDMTEEDLENEILEAVNIRLFISALCQAENIIVTDEEYSAFLNDQYYYYGYEDTASFEADYGKEYILWALYENKVSSFLLENAKVNEVEYSYTEDYDEEYDFGEELDGLENPEEEGSAALNLAQDEEVDVVEEPQNGE